MHTARQLDASLFEITLDGSPAGRDQLLRGWGVDDRLGIIVDRPFGAVGASLLLQLAITAYYDARPARRETLLYPEVYLFHVGGRHGDHSHFDVFPPRKEVDVEDDAALILEAINDRAITRLAVVDGPSATVCHHWKEPAAAQDRILTTIAYSPDGRVADPDVSITGHGPRVTANTKKTLHPPEESYAEQAAARAALGPFGAVPSSEEMLPDVDRWHEVPLETRDQIAAERSAISAAGSVTETYRRLTVAEALGMLHCRPA
jgi:hypothetical protein